MFFYLYMLKSFLHCHKSYGSWHLTQGFDVGGIMTDTACGTGAKPSGASDLKSGC